MTYHQKSRNFSVRMTKLGLLLSVYGHHQHYNRRHGGSKSQNNLPGSISLTESQMIKQIKISLVWVFNLNLLRQPHNWAYERQALKRNPVNENVTTSISINNLGKKGDSLPSLKQLRRLLNMNQCNRRPRHTGINGQSQCQASTNILPGSLRMHP